MNRTGGVAVNAHQPYRVRRIPRGRQVILDVLAGAARSYPVHALVEFDVTVAEQRLRDRGGAVSWTGFVVATVARALAAHPEVNARCAGGRLLVFDRVDVAVTVERPVDGALVPVAVTVRNADRKPGQAITEELQRAETRRPAVAAGFGPAVGSLRWECSPPAAGGRSRSRR